MAVDKEKGKEKEAMEEETLQEEQGQQKNVATKIFYKIFLGKVEQAK